MAEKVKKKSAESYPITNGIIGEIKKWYWALLLIMSLSATAFNVVSRITYKPVYQSYATLAPSYQDGTTAEIIEEIAEELTNKERDGRLAAFASNTGGQDADIRFAADGPELVVSVRASEPLVSYETLRSIVEQVTELLDTKPDFTLVLTFDSGVPKTVTNPLDSVTETMRGLLAGAVLAIVFLVICLIRDKKKAAKRDAETPAVPDDVYKPASFEEAFSEKAPETKAEPLPVTAALEAAAPELKQTLPEKEEKNTVGGIPADLARFASAIGTEGFEIPAAAPADEGERSSKEEAADAASVPVEPTEEPNTEAPEEEWDPNKTSLSREMWEIAKELGMLDNFRI